MTASPTRTALDWEYSPAPEATDHIRLADRYGLFVDGAGGRRSRGLRADASTRRPRSR